MPPPPQAQEQQAWAGLGLPPRRAKRGSGDWGDTWAATGSNCSPSHHLASHLIHSDTPNLPAPSLLHLLQALCSGSRVAGNCWRRLSHAHRHHQWSMGPSQWPTPLPPGPAQCSPAFPTIATLSFKHCPPAPGPSAAPSGAADNLSPIFQRI